MTYIDWWLVERHQNTVLFNLYNIQLYLSAILIHNVSNFWIVTVLSNHIFVTRSPQRLPTAEFTMLLDKPFLRTYATVPAVPCISHAHPHARTTFKCVFHYALFLYFSRSFPLPPTRTRIHSNTSNVYTLYASVRTCRVSWFNNSLR